MNLKLKKMIKIQNIHKKFNVIISYFFLIAFAIHLNAQSLDENFLNQLPNEIREDVISQIKDSPSNVLPLSKTYDSFDSKMKKNNSISAKKNIEKFGDKFFLNTPSTFMPINDPSANSGYILDVDDEVSILITGSRSESYNYKINRSGEIALNDIGMVNIAGLSIDSANKVINDLLSANFVDIEAVVSLSKIRDIEVLITGQVSKPGIYILNGYSSVLHAIVMAGGVSEYGTLRNIKLKRPGRDNKIIDLYNILVFGDTSSIVSLRSGDSIHIEASQNFIPVLGGVAEPAIYEYKEGESFEDIIKYSGGIIKESIGQPIIVSRFDNGEIKTFHVKSNKSIKRGDRIFVPFNLFEADQLLVDEDYQFLNDPVEITGAVMRPGKYYLNSSEKMSHLIEKAGGYSENAYILGGVLTNKEAKIKETLYNEKLYNEALRSLISISQASTKVDISKLMPILSEFKNTEPNGRIISEFDIFKINANPELDTTLSPGDNVHIPFKTNVVHVFGEVLNTGSVTYSAGMNVYDYIEASGGLNNSADKKRIILVYPNGEARKVNFRNNVFNSNHHDIYPGSVIYVSRDMREIEGLDLAATIAPIFSSLAISLASINSINKN
jgi:protein involved in polysaccharide export with SLBB domain